jgi:hypothetical protein
MPSDHSAGAHQPWLRLPEESSTAYEAFCAYRDLEVNIRSITAAYHHFRNLPKPNTTRAPGRWNEWFRCFRWRERA